VSTRPATLARDPASRARTLDVACGTERHELADEIGGEVLLDGRWFVAARVTW
jgi:hypothetical protein